MLSTADQLNEIRHELLAGKDQGSRRVRIANLVASLRREQQKSLSTSPATRDASTELPAVSDSEGEEHSFVDFDSDSSPSSRAHTATASAGTSPHRPSLASMFEANTEHGEQHADDSDIHSFFRRVRLPGVKSLPLTT